MMPNLQGTMLTEKELAAFGFRALGKNILISSRASLYGIKHISLGDNVRIDDFTVISASAPVMIGNYVHIANHCTIIAKEAFAMEDYSTISAGVRVFTGSDDFSGEAMTNPTVPDKYTNVKAAKVMIGKHCVVGTNSVLLPGVTLGEGVAVGAVSLVKESLEAWGIYAGSPAERIKDRSQKLLKKLEEWQNE